MYHDIEQFQLSFVERGQHTCTAPELILTIHRNQLPVIVDRLMLLRQRLSSTATTYLAGVHHSFVLPAFDLFGESSFGYHECGYIVTDETRAHLHLPFRGARATPFTAFTLQLLKLSLLHIDHKDVSLGNRRQQYDFDLSTDNHRPNGYGHAIGGYLAHEVTAWLETYRTRPTTPKYHNGDAAMPSAILAAMQDAWRATARDSWQEYVEDCGGRIFAGGAFILDCFGNACDVGVYPSEYHPDEPSHAISCHNLDTVEQQLTLLAGLAKICQLAREDTV